MKSIKLPLQKCKDYEQYKYYIYVGNGTNVYFNNKRKGEDYIRELSNVMNDVIRILISSHNNTYTTYLNNYFELQNVEVCDNYVSSFHNRLNYSFRYFGEGNETLVIENVYKLFDISRCFIKSLKRSFQKLNKYAIVNNLNGTLLLLDSIEQRYDLLFNQKSINRIYKQENTKIVYLKKSVS